MDACCRYSEKLLQPYTSSQKLSWFFFLFFIERPRLLEWLLFLSAAIRRHAQTSGKAPKDTLNSSVHTLGLLLVTKPSLPQMKLPNLKSEKEGFSSLSSRHSGTSNPCRYKEKQTNEVVLFEVVQVETERCSSPERRNKRVLLKRSSFLLP